MKNEIDYEKKMKEIMRMGYNTAVPIYWGNSVLFRHMISEKSTLAGLACDTGKIDIYEL